MCYVCCKEQCFACPVCYVTANRLAWSIYSGVESYVLCWEFLSVR